MFDFMDKQDVQLAKSYIQRGKKGIKEQHEHTLICKDGSYIFASLEISTLYDNDGKYIGALAGLQDITKRKQAEKEVRETEQKLRSLIEKCPASVMLLDEQGRVNFVNDWHIEKFANNKLGKDYFFWQNHTRTARTG